MKMRMNAWSTPVLIIAVLVSGYTTAWAQEKARTSENTPALKKLLQRRPDTLSGGERQRVAIGRALLTRPRLLLMDEPLAALDLDRKGEILPYIDALPRLFGVPVIYVTHSLDEVVRLADRMVVLGAGRKVAEGTVSEVLQRLDLGPSTGRFEAGAVIEATVVSHDDDYRLTRLDHHGQDLRIPMVDAATGQTLRLRIRARDVSLATTRPQGVSIRNILRATVAEVRGEPHTAFAEVLVDIGGGRLRSRVTREAVDALGLRTGQPVFALVKSIAFDRRSVLGAGSRLSEKTRGALAGTTGEQDNE